MPFCKLFAGFDSTNTSAISFLFLSSCSVLSFYLNLSADLAKTVVSFLLFYQNRDGYLFHPGNDAADELARQRALFVLSAIPCSLSSLTSHIHSCIFSDWRCIVLFKFFDTQIPSVFTACVPSSRSPCALSLVSAATDTAFC